MAATVASNSSPELASFRWNGNIFGLLALTLYWQLQSGRFRHTLTLAFRMVKCNQSDIGNDVRETEKFMIATSSNATQQSIGTDMMLSLIHI